MNIGSRRHRSDPATAKEKASVENSEDRVTKRNCIARSISTSFRRSCARTAAKFEAAAEKAFTAPDRSDKISAARSIVTRPQATVTTRSRKWPRRRRRSGCNISASPITAAARSRRADSMARALRAQVAAIRKSKRRVRKLPPLRRRRMRHPARRLARFRRRNAGRTRLRRRVSAFGFHICRKRK